MEIPVIFLTLNLSSLFSGYYRLNRVLMKYENETGTGRLMIDFVSLYTVYRILNVEVIFHTGQLFFVTVSEAGTKWVFGRGRNCQIRSLEDVKTGRTISSFTNWEIWVSFC